MKFNIDRRWAVKRAGGGRGCFRLARRYRVRYRFSQRGAPVSRTEDAGTGGRTETAPANSQNEEIVVSVCSAGVGMK